MNSKCPLIYKKNKNEKEKKNPVSIFSIIHSQKPVPLCFLILQKQCKSLIMIGNRRLFRDSATLK
jgi:hypothetical protein